MRDVSLKDMKYFIVFSVPILFFISQMDWSFDGISDLIFGILLFLLFPSFLFILQIYYFLHLDRKLRQAGRIKSKIPFVISYSTVVMFDLLISGMGALDTYRGIQGSALNVIMLFYLPFINVGIIILIYPVTILLFCPDSREN